MAAIAFFLVSLYLAIFSRHVVVGRTRGMFDGSYDEKWCTWIILQRKRRFRPAGCCIHREPHDRLLRPLKMFKEPHGKTKCQDGGDFDLDPDPSASLFGQLQEFFIVVGSNDLAELKLQPTTILGPMPSCPLSGFTFASFDPLSPTWNLFNHA